jgi:enolase
MSIRSITAREVFDSRGNPTVECTITTNNGNFSAIVPSGASTGVHEALELRDNDKKRFSGKGVLNAVKNINTVIAKKLKGFDETKQKELDQLLIALDGTKNKSRLGANAILAVSMAACRAGAAAKNISLYRHISSLTTTAQTDKGRKSGKFILPVPCLNVINGGRHAGNQLAFQEFMLVPLGAKTFRQAMQMGVETYQCLKTILKEKYGLNSVNVGDEGGFAPPLNTPGEALELLTAAIKKAGYQKKIRIAMDVAASEMYSGNNALNYESYNLNFKNSKEPKNLSSRQLAELYKALIKNFPIISIEDPFDQDDWESFISFTQNTQRAGTKVQIVGDDLLVTNPERIHKAVKLKACNALLLKLNQIGTVSESIDAFSLASSAGWNVMVSHRSGETEDSFIADLVVALGAGQLKSGAPCRSERLAKYNRLLRIEEELGRNCVYAGKNFMK